MSTIPKKLSESNSQLYASMEHARPNAFANDPSGILPAIIACMIAIPSAVALAISSYLAYATFTMSEVAGCGSGSIFDCGHVLHSKWSKAFGIPVSVLAIATHVLLLASLYINQSDRFSKTFRSLATRPVFMASVAAALAAFYFIVIQIFVLDHLCSYCMVAHACGLFIAAIAVWKFPIESSLRRKLTGVAIAGVATLALIQISSAKPPTYKIESLAPFDAHSENTKPENGDSNAEPNALFSAPGEVDTDDSDIFSAPIDDEASAKPRPHDRPSVSTMFPKVRNLFVATHLFPSATLLMPATPLQNSVPSGSTKDVATNDNVRLVPMIGGSVKLKATDWPLIGNPDAKHIFVEMFDYTCEHCRSTNKAIEVAKQSLGDDLAVVTLPVPMNRTCNPSVTKSSPVHAEACELSKLAIAVWRVAPETFADFHHWMFAGQTAPTYSAALAKAQELVDATALEKELGKSICDQYVSRNVLLYKKVGGGPIPKMIFKQTAIVGEFTSGDTLTDLIREYTEK